MDKRCQRPRLVEATPNPDEETSHLRVAGGRPSSPSERPTLSLDEGTETHDEKEREKEDAGVTVLATLGMPPDRQEEIHYKETEQISKKMFSSVAQARMSNGDVVVVKKIDHDPRFKCRELKILRKMDHRNIVRLNYFFYKTVREGKEFEAVDKRILHLVMEYLPGTLHLSLKAHRRLKEPISMLCVKVYTFQLFRALAYIHAKGVCHRDLKPQNLLLDPQTGVLKLCDFGSAKQLVHSEPNTTYICTRYYRAPELLLGASDYAFPVDIWAAGCVVGELILGQTLFEGRNGMDQLVEIIKYLGPPSCEQVEEMNAKYSSFKFPQVTPIPWQRVLPPRAQPEAVDLLSQLLEYMPSKRPKAVQVCFHPFFDELREPGKVLPSGAPLPPLFDFSSEEVGILPKFKELRLSVLQ